MSGSLSYQLEDLNVTLFGRYIGRHHGTQYRAFKDEDTSESELEVASHITWNLTAGYDITEQINVQAGVVNIFDRGPNFDPTDTSWPHYSRSLYNAVGREFFVEAELRF